MRNARNFPRGLSERQTVEKLALDAIDARELQRADAFRDHWAVVRNPYMHWPAVTKMLVSRYLIRVELRNHCDGGAVIAFQHIRTKRHKNKRDLARASGRWLRE